MKTLARLRLIRRLVARDLRRRPAEAGLLLLVIAAAATTLTLGLDLNGVAADGPYSLTRAATHGPDVVAIQTQPSGPAGPTELTGLFTAAGVVGHDGPYPTSSPVLKANGYTVPVLAEGRDTGPAALDQPELTQGSWVQPGGVVLERSFADALGVGAGGSVTLNGRAYKVVGVAITAAFLPYPSVNIGVGYSNYGSPSGPGLVWLTRDDAESLAAGSAKPLFYTANLKLADPAAATDFENTHGIAAADSQPGLYVTSWQDISSTDGLLLSREQTLLLVASWLLGLFAVSSVAVLVGGRMADQTRRVGLLKAVGGTPGLITLVLLAENLFLALVAAAVGLAAGRLAAPLVTSPGASLVNAPNTAALTPAVAGLVAGLALAVAVAATLVPAVHAARISTVRALTESAQRPRRGALLIRLSARLPVPLLLGLRLAARRPRRTVLSALSITITVATVVTVMTTFASDPAQTATGLLTPGSPKNLRTQHLVLAFTLALVLLALVNVVFITWSTALDSRRPMSVARALGASPRQVTAALSAAQLFPALLGAVLGIPAGLGLFAALSHGRPTVTPPLWWLLGTVLGTLVVLAALSSVPARLGARRPVAEVLRAEVA